MTNRLPKVLVVDDDRVIADTLAAILNNGGFDATPVYRGEDALLAARQSPPDAVVCDIMLGGINGIEVATQIRTILPDCRIILISGAGESGGLLEQTRAAGEEFEVIAKPFHPTTLLDRLRRAFGPSTEAA